MIERAAAIESLWEFASTRYLQDGVAQACLALQDDFGADVNLVLTAAWLALQGRPWQIGEIDRITAACAQWRSHCLLPLRAIRRDLKRVPGAENWYQRIKALELEAERQQLHRIEETVASFATPAPDAADPQALVETNLRLYLSTLPALDAGRARAEAATLTRLLLEPAAAST